MINYLDFDDAAHVQRALAGDPGATEALVQQYYGTVYSIALANLGYDPERAEDLCQEALLRAFLNLGSLRKPAYFPLWLVQVTRNLAKEWNRLNRRRSGIVQMVGMEAEELRKMSSDGPNPREAASAAETAARVKQALQKLSAEEREILLMHYTEEVSQAEIARRLGVHPTTVLRKIEAALRKMRSAMGADAVASLKHREALPSRSRRAVGVVLTAMAMSPGARSALAAACPIAGLQSSAGGVGALVASKFALGAAALLVVAAAVALPRQPKPASLVAGSALGSTAPAVRVSSISSNRAGGLRSALKGTTAGWATTRAEAATTTPKAGSLFASNNSHHVRVVDGDTGKPIAGSVVECRGILSAGGQPITSATTSVDGTCAFSKSTEILNALDLRAEAPGYATRTYTWLLREGIQVPSDEIVLKLPRGTKVGGFVRNHAGNPVAGAKVVLSRGRYEKEGSAITIEYTVTNTDAGGKWAMEVSPINLTDFRASVEHPEYADWWSRDHALPADSLLQQQWEIVLGEGIQVHGVVTGADRKPIAGAMIADKSHAVERPPIRTDNEGRFVIPHVLPEEMIVLQVKAEGFAQAQAEVLPLPGMNPVEIPISRGRPFAVRVVDSAGAPVPGAVVQPNRWMKKAMRQTDVGWSGTTDVNGEVTWSNAPDVELKWQVTAPGFRREEFTLAAEGGKHDVTLLRSQRIHGEVVEMGSGKNVEEFQVVQGPVLTSASARWGEAIRPAVTGAHGRFELSNEDRSTTNQLMVLSSRHLPCATGPISAAADDVTTRVTLVPAPPGLVRVLDPAGSPASSASLCLLTRWSGVTDIGKGPKVNGPYPIFHAETDGIFTVPPQDASFTLAVWSDAGYAEKKFESTTAPMELRLEPWAVVEGDLPEFEPGERVTALTVTRSPASRSSVVFLPTATVDANGHFEFPRLRPGEWTFYAGNAKWAAFHQMAQYAMRVPLVAGEHRVLRLGEGAGVVMGSIDLKTTGGQVVDVSSDRVVLTSYDRNQVYRTSVAAYGAFRFTRIPEGRYSLSFQANKLKPELDRMMLAWGVKDLTVPGDAGASQVEVNVGKLGVVRAGTLGHPASDIETVTSDSRAIHLSDFRGKWVVVDFWGEGCGGCINAMKETLKPLWDHYREGGRLVIYSVALTENRQACEKLIRELKFDWIFGFAKNSYEEAASAYQFAGVPALFLIDPQGIVAAADVEEAELMKKVEQLVH